MENWISLLVVPYTMMPFLISLYTTKIRWFFLGLLILSSMATTDILKRLTNSMPYTWLKRPIGASNCNTSMTDGDQSGRPGFPSGHCTCAAAFWVGVWILTPSPYKIWMGLVGCVGITSMMWARQKKRCHTGLQTVAGVAVGSMYALLL